MEMFDSVEWKALEEKELAIAEAMSETDFYAWWEKGPLFGERELQFPRVGPDFSVMLMLMLLPPETNCWVLYMSQP
jgi:hypothetical protein